jgi:hypothetical protein
MCQPELHQCEQAFSLYPLCNYSVVTLRSAVFGVKLWRKYDNTYYLALRQRLAIVGVFGFASVQPLHRFSYRNHYVDLGTKPPEASVYAY